MRAILATAETGKEVRRTSAHRARVHSAIISMTSSDTEARDVYTRTLHACSDQRDRGDCRAAKIYLSR